MREGGPPPPRFASLRPNVTVSAAASTTADVRPFRMLLSRVTLLVINRLQLLLRVLCER
jgi:hypothetical protein